jgi:hypothetical protein
MAESGIGQSDTVAERIPAAIRTHIVDGEPLTTAIPLCRCATPIANLWSGDCSLCRGAILAAHERPVSIKRPALRVMP